MKFKNQENMNFVLDINDNDTVLKVKMELSKKILVSSDNIILMFKNKLLDNHKLISDFNISENEFVIFYLRTDYIANVILNLVSSKANEKSSTFSILMNGFLRGKYISTLLTRSNKKSITFRECFLLFKCVNADYGIVKVRFYSGLLVDEVKNTISKEIDIPVINIQMFLDVNLNRPVIGQKDLDEISKSSNKKLDLYYKLTSNLGDLIKLELLGRGAYGNVYRGIEIGTKRQFALKKFVISKNFDREYGKLTTEIDLLCKVKRHDRIVKFETQIQKNNAVYVVMDFMSKGSLRKFLQTNGPLSEKLISKFSRQILEGLEYLHGQEILHRDIKADNIIFDGEGNVRLSDFGLAKILVELSSGDLLNGAVTSNMATANWLAPEIINGDMFDVFADIWSFGATVLEMLTGNPPYHKLTQYQVVYKICTEKTIEYAKPEYMSNSLKVLIDSCLQPEPINRPTTTELLKHEFLKKHVDFSDLACLML